MSEEITEEASFVKALRRSPRVISTGERRSASPPMTSMFKKTRAEFLAWLESKPDEPDGCQVCGAMAGCCGKFPHCPGNPNWSPKMSDAEIEKLIQEKGADIAPRVTPQMLEDVIAGEYYFTGSDGANGSDWPEHFRGDASTFNALRLLTFCVLVLKNGFTVTGESACASPENFKPEIGRKVAREHAKQKLWPLLGYNLKQRLFEEADRLNVPPAATETTWLDRLRDERDQNAERLRKLSAFVETEEFRKLPEDMRSLLEQQSSVMFNLDGILYSRIMLAAQRESPAQEPT